MAQYSWIYKNKVGIDYEVSIYHGDESGHVLIYSNQAIISIDFSVKTDKAFSFMLGKELFELRISFEKEYPSYLLKNMDTNTTISQVETINFPKRHIKIALILVTLLGLLITIIFQFLIK